MVELENDWIRVTVLPEIGGKIWTAVEKSTGKSFLYGNQVVKFRDVAMRGPWTSGGIEANYGIIGHTPNCATPVDYVTRQDPDGSASVVIGVLDLLTRTPWRLEIRLPGDKAYFTTTSLWHNATPLEQPYYTWMNTGLKAAGNLQFVYPGTHFIGHGGEASPWPIDPKTGRDLSFYEKNDFGPYKSYHVLGRESDFWGAFWHDDDFGMGRYSPRDEKLGKKIWIWGLSRQGMIWEKLLTDTDGQYVEVQSGRSFNQAAEESTRTPFKHRGFLPYGTDTWTEYWFPVKGTKGFVAASPLGALNVRPRDGGLDVLLSPLEAVSDTLEVLDGDRVVFTTPVEAKPLETWTVAVPVAAPLERLRVRIGGKRLEWTGDPKAGELSRPLESPADFDWDSVYGLWLKGKEPLRQRFYGPAREALEACLRKDPHYVPALADLALLRYRSMDYAGAFDLARRALAIDTYDPAANYYYGLAAAKLGRTDDARDGFELAAQSVELRGAAWTELAKLALRGGDLARRRLRRRAEPRLQLAQPRGAPDPRPGPPRAERHGEGERGPRRAARPGPAEPLRPLRAGPRRGRGRAPRLRRRRPQRDAAGDVPRAGLLVPRRRPAGRRRAGAGAVAADGRGPLLAGLAEARGRRIRGPPPEGRRGVPRARLPLPPGVGRGPGVGGVEEHELASPLLPGARPVGRRQRRRGAPALRGVRRGARLRALLRRALARLRGRLARAVDGRPRAGGPARPRAVALRADAGRPTAAPGRGGNGAGDGPRLRGAVPRQLHPRHAAREGAPRERALPGERGEARPA